MSEQQSYGREYEAQARIITELRAQVDSFRKRNVELELKYKDAIFYRALSEAIKQNETLQGEWISFVSLLRLCAPELEERIKAEVKAYEERTFKTFY